MKPFLDRSWREEAARAVREQCPGVRPRVAVILGSGWTLPAEGWTERGAIPYHRIPGLGAPSVSGHPGRLAAFGLPAGDLLVFQGRRHWYEAADWNPVAVPIHLARRLGCRAVVLTNAAGGIRADLEPGRLMIIEDHHNAVGWNPLVGNSDWWSETPFPDLSETYDATLREILSAVGRERGLDLAGGVYAAVSGPSYETPAEIRALRNLGADAVGMSTVPEAILARAAGLKVAGLTLISNRAAGLGGRRLTHEEVLQTGRQSAGRVTAFLAAVLERMVGHPALRAEERT